MNKAKKTQKESKRKYTGKKNEGHSATITSKEGSKGSSILAGKPHKLKPDKGLAVPVTLT